MFITILFDSSDGISDTSFVVLIFMLWFVSIPKNYDGYFNIIKKSVIYSFFIGSILSIIDIVILKDSSYFTYNMAGKGLSFVDAFIGLSNIPQTFGTLGLMTYLVLQSSNRHLSKSALFIANLAFNRVTLILSAIIVFRKNIIIYFSLLIVALILLYFYVDSDSLFAMHSITNRVGLTLGIWDKYINGSFIDILIGVKTKPGVFYMSGNGGIDYIENGYMFLLYYYGLLGAACYILFFLSWIIVIPFCFKMKINKLDLYIALLYFFIVPLFTHEIAHINFYIMMYVLFYRTYKHRVDHVEKFPY